MKPSFEKSSKTEILVNVFREMGMNQPISFADLSRRCGFPVKSDLPSYQSAKRIARRDHQVVIDPIHKFGCQRVSGEGIVRRGARIMKGMRGRAKVGAQEAEIALTHNMDRNMQQVASQNLTRFRLIADVASAAKSNRAVVSEPDLVAKT